MCQHYNSRVIKSLTNVNTKTISNDKCIHSDLPKVINETDKDIMDKIATHSYQAFAFYFKRVTIGKYKQNCHICFINHIQTLYSITGEERINKITLKWRHTDVTVLYKKTWVFSRLFQYRLITLISIIGLHINQAIVIASFRYRQPYQGNNRPGYHSLTTLSTTNTG